MNNLMPAMPKIETKEEALNWAIDKITDVEERRLLLASTYKTPGATVGQLRRKFQGFLMRYGVAMGGISTLWATGYLTDEQYQQLRTRNDAVILAATASLRDFFD